MNSSDSLTEDKKIECREVFDLFDKNKEGLISTEDLGDAMRALGANPTQSEVNDIIKDIDPEGLGKVEFTDFIKQFEKKMKDPDTEEDLLESFKLFDKDGNGVISKDELVHLMTTLGENFTLEDAEEMVREADINNEGFVRYHDFVKLLMSNINM